MRTGKRSRAARTPARRACASALLWLLKARVRVRAGGRKTGSRTLRLCFPLWLLLVLVHIHFHTHAHLEARLVLRLIHPHTPLPQVQARSRRIPEQHVRREPRGRRGLYRGARRRAGREGEERPSRPRRCVHVMR